DLGDDGQAGGRARLGEDLEALLAEALERVRGGAGLVGAAPQHLGAGALDDVGRLQRLLAALDAAGAGGDDEPAVAGLHPADHHERVVVPELARGELERLRDAHDRLDARQPGEVLPELLGGRGADRADQRARLALADVGHEAPALDLAYDLLDRRRVGVLTHDDDHGTFSRALVGTGVVPLTGRALVLTVASEGETSGRRGGGQAEVAVAVFHGTTSSARWRHARKSTTEAAPLVNGGRLGSRGCGGPAGPRRRRGRDAPRAPGARAPARGHAGAQRAGWRRAAS